VVNGSGADYPEKTFKHLDSAEIDDLSLASSLCWDDISKPTLPELKKLRKILTFSKNHKHCTVHMIVHSCGGNGVSSLLPHFDHVIFAPGLRNSFNFQDFV
jgi:hypothetical protein